MKVLVLLSGCGVYDGSEIHESVFAMLSLSQNNLEFICAAPDIKHHHVVNHLTGEDQKEERNVLSESARIARGDVCSLDDVDFSSVSSLVIPGGFGAAKNLSDWAFKGVDSLVLPAVKNLILHCFENKKPVVALCISPVVVVKSLEGSSLGPLVSVGSVNEKSRYDISEIHGFLSSLGAKTENRSISEVLYDEDLRLISAPCYMMESTADQVYSNTKMAIDKLADIL